MTNDLRALFDGLSFEQKRQFLAAVRGLLETTAEKLAQDYDSNMSSQQRRTAIPEVIGLQQLIYSYQDGLRALEKNPQASLDSLWAALEKYMSAQGSKS